MFSHYYVWWGYDTGWIPDPVVVGAHRHAHFHARKGYARMNIPVPCEMGRKLLAGYSGEDYGYDHEPCRVQ